MKYFLAVALALVSSPASAQGPGDAAPAIQFEHSFQGPAPDTIQWTALEGRAVVLDFWATWCVPCLAAVPHLEQLAEELSDERIQFVLVTDEKPAVVKKFLAKRKLPGWVVSDTDRSVFTAFGIKAFPPVVVVDGRGRVMLRGHSKDLTVAALRAIARGEFKPPLANDPGAVEKVEGTPRYLFAVAGHDPLASPFIEAGLVNMRKLSYQTILRPTMDPKAEAVYGTTTKRGGSGVTLIAKTPLELAGYVGHFPVTRIVDEAGLGQTKWDFILSRPATPLLSQLRVEAGQVYDEVFEVVRKPVTVQRAVLVATADPSKLTRVADIDPEDPTAISFVPLISALRHYEAQTGQIVVEEIEGAKDLRIDTFGINFLYGDGETLGAWLRDKGLRFESAKRAVEILRLVARE